MKPSLRGPGVLFLLLVCVGLLAACGKKGPPLPPLSRVPAPPANPQAARFGVVAVDAPLPLPRFGMSMVVPEVALMDGGLAWLVALLRRTSRSRSRR